MLGRHILKKKKLIKFVSMILLKNSYVFGNILITMVGQYGNFNIGRQKMKENNLSPLRIWLKDFYKE